MNRFIVGDCEKHLGNLAKESIDLVLTSPPYFNARPEYQTYKSYEAYLSTMQGVIFKLHRVLKEGRIIVFNASSVIVARRTRNESSTRLNLPADLHHLFDRSKFEFIEEIVWEKPEGAGCGRGRRFSVDRHPLQYKTVPVTERLLVYRKRSPKLIDAVIRANRYAHKSRIQGEYERTDVWRISPAKNKVHPAVFPLQLAENVIRYYSFVNDVVLDPFAGVGTVGLAAAKHHRNYYLIEQKQEYAAEFERLLREMNRSLICSKDILRATSQQSCFTGFGRRLRLTA